jgi:predicted  nucleic acid-binding Zn-ribbon protein
MPETTEERAARVAKLEKARQELKRIQTELTKVRERHQQLLDQRHAAEADRKIESREQQLAQADRRREQRALESKLKELNTSLRQIQSLRSSLDTVAAHVPWTIPVEAEALKLALTKKPAIAK